jgi:hypothetical protein
MNNTKPVLKEVLQGSILGFLLILSSINILPNCTYVLAKTMSDNELRIVRNKKKLMLNSTIFGKTICYNMVWQIVLVFIKPFCAKRLI